MLSTRNAAIWDEFSLFFFYVLQMLCAPICKTNDRFASYESKIWSLVFIKENVCMGTRNMIWFLIGSRLIPSHFSVLSSLWLVITQSTFLCVIPCVVWQQLLSLRKLSSILFSSSEKKIRLRLTEIPWSFPGKLLWFHRNCRHPRTI